MANPTIVIPKDQLQGMKPWRPDALKARPTAAERRAANQPEPPADDRRGQSPDDQPLAAARTPLLAAHEWSVIEAARAALELDSARVEAERAAARRAGFTEGFESGYAEGKALVDAHLARLQSISAAMQTSIAQFDEAIADQLTKLSLDLARRVIRTELNVHPEAMLALVQEALRAVPEGGAKGEIRLHPNDLDLVRTKLTLEPSLGNWSLAPDATIEAGGCRVVTRLCDIDATLGTRWKQAMHSLGFTEAWKA